MQYRTNTAPHAVLFQSLILKFVTSIAVSKVFQNIYEAFLTQILNHLSRRQFRPIHITNIDKQGPYTKTYSTLC